MYYIFMEGIEGSEIETTAKVPSCCLVRTFTGFDLKKAEIHVCRGDERVSRMNDDGNRDSLEWSAA